MESLAVGCESGGPGSLGAEQEGEVRVAVTGQGQGMPTGTVPAGWATPVQGGGLHPGFLAELGSTEELPWQDLCLSWAGPCHQALPLLPVVTC